MLTCQPAVPYSLAGNLDQEDNQKTQEEDLCMKNAEG